MTTWYQLTPAERWQTMKCMEDYGGGFCRQLVRLMQVADSGNMDRIVRAFDHVIDKYQPKNWSNHVQDTHRA